MKLLRNLKKGKYPRIYEVIPVVNVDIRNRNLSIVYEHHYILGIRIGIATRKLTKEEHKELNNKFL